MKQNIFNSKGLPVSMSAPPMPKVSAPKIEVETELSSLNIECSMRQQVTNQMKAHPEIFFSPIRQLIVTRIEGSKYEKELLKLAFQNYSFLLSKTKKYSFAEFANEIEKVYDTKVNANNKAIVDTLREVHQRYCHGQQS